MVAGDHPLTVFVEIYSADAYRGCHVQHSRTRVDVLVVRFAYLLSLSGSLLQDLSVKWAVMAEAGAQGPDSLQAMKRPPLCGPNRGRGRERT